MAMMQTPLLHPVLRYGLGSRERDDWGEYPDDTLGMVA